MDPVVAVIIPTRGKPELVNACLEALFPAVGEIPIEVLVLEQGGEESKRLIEEKYADKPVRWMVSEEGWSYSDVNNAGAQATAAPFLLLLNNDTLPTPGFLETMVSKLEDPTVGIVGAKLLHPDETIQHIGVVFTAAGVPHHIGWGKKNDGSFEPANRDDEYPSVTFACALIRRSVWDEVGGMDTDYFWNYEDTDFCLHAKQRGYRCVVAINAVVYHLEGKTSDHRTTPDHTVARNLRVFRDKWITTGELEKVIYKKIDRASGYLTEGRLNLAFIPSSRRAGVPWWRVEIPARKINKLRLANAKVIYTDQPSAVLAEHLNGADITIFQGFCSEWVDNVFSLGLFKEYPVVYDYDDHPLYISPFAHAYKWFGCQEIRLRAADGSDLWLWRDGEHGFDLGRNVQARSTQLEIIYKSDRVTTTTLPLQDYFKTLNPRVSVLPNAIDFDVYQDMAEVWQRKPGPVRIGWHGGDNHFHDLSLVGKPLVDYVNTHDVRLVLFGAHYPGTLKQIDKNKLVLYPWVDVEAFPYRLQQLGIDVALVPLADPSDRFLKFNHYKSPIKFLEYAALRIPSLVAEGRAAYSVCADEVNALTFSTDEEFTEKLDRLCRHADFRSDLGNRAYDYAREYHDFDKVIHRWIECYQQSVKDFSERKSKFPAAEILEEIKRQDEALEADAALVARSIAVPEGAPCPQAP